MSQNATWEDLLENERTPRCCCPPVECCQNVIRVEADVSFSYSCHDDIVGLPPLPTCTVDESGSGSRLFSWTAAAEELTIVEDTIGTCEIGVSAAKSMQVSMTVRRGGDDECRHTSNSTLEEYDVTVDLDLDCEGNGTGLLSFSGPKAGAGITLNFTFAGYAGAVGEIASVSDTDSNTVSPPGSCDSGSRVLSATVTVYAIDVEG